MPHSISSPVKLINKRFNNHNQDKPISYLDKINDFTKYLPLTTLMALIYGNLRIFIYYTSFNINIYDFVNFDELLKFAIRDIIPASLIFGFILFISDVVKRNFIITSVILVLFVGGVFILSILNPSQLLTDALSAFAMILAIIISVEFATIASARPLILVGTLALLIFAIAFHTSIVSYTLVTQNLINTGEYIVLKSGDKIVSDNNFIYIGKTTDYLFFFNKNLGITTAYRMDEVFSLSVGYSF
jgi:hypothetical protein